MSADQKDKRLLEFLENGKDWERKQTNIPGVFLIRLPQFRSRPACIGVELDALNRGGGGNRRRGIILRTSEELQQLLDIVTNKKLSELTSSIEKVNPVQQANMGVHLDNEILKYKVVNLLLKNLLMVSTSFCIIGLFLYLVGMSNKISPVTGFNYILQIMSY